MVPKLNQKGIGRDPKESQNNSKVIVRLRVSLRMRKKWVVGEVVRGMVRKERKRRREVGMGRRIGRRWVGVRRRIRMVRVGLRLWIIVNMTDKMRYDFNLWYSRQYLLSLGGYIHSIYPIHSTGPAANTPPITLSHPIPFPYTTATTAGNAITCTTAITLPTTYS